MTTSWQRSPVYNDHYFGVQFSTYKEQRNFWTTIRCQQQPLFLGPKCGRCTKVSLNYNINALGDPKVGLRPKLILKDSNDVSHFFQIIWEHYTTFWIKGYFVLNFGTGSNLEYQRFRLRHPSILLFEWLLFSNITPPRGIKPTVSFTDLDLC